MLASSNLPVAKGVMEVGSFLVVRIVSIARTGPPRHPVFLVLRAGAQTWTSLPCDEEGQFCQQCVFQDVQDKVHVDVLIKRPFPFFDKRVGSGVLAVAPIEVNAPLFCFAINADFLFCLASLRM